MVWAVYWANLALTVGVCIFAIAKGDVPTRLGGSIRLSVQAAEICVQWALQTFLPHNNTWVAVDDLLNTAVMSFGFLYLALRYASPWLAAAMVIEGSAFYTARVFLDVNPGDHMNYALEENLIAIGVASCLFVATLSAIRQRQKRRLADAERQKKADARAARIEALSSTSYEAVVA